jgi:hypothetical protein
MHLPPPDVIHSLVFLSNTLRLLLLRVVAFNGKFVYLVVVPFAMLLEIRHVQKPKHFPAFSQQLLFFFLPPPLTFLVFLLLPNVVGLTTLVLPNNLLRHLDLLLLILLHQLVLLVKFTVSLQLLQPALPVPFPQHLLLLELEIHLVPLLLRYLLQQTPPCLRLLLLDREELLHLFLLGRGEFHPEYLLLLLHPTASLLDLLLFLLQLVIVLFQIHQVLVELRHTRVQVLHLLHLHVLRHRRILLLRNVLRLGLDHYRLELGQLLSLLHPRRLLENERVFLGLLILLLALRQIQVLFPNHPQIDITPITIFVVFLLPDWLLALRNEGLFLGLNPRRRSRRMSVQHRGLMFALRKMRVNKLVTD